MEVKSDKLNGEMTMEEQSKPTNTGEGTTAGGVAPAERQCTYTRSNGQRCRDWSLRGHEQCFRHHRYLHARPERPIEVPLLEDDDAVLYLLSQALQALAWGTIPVSNGRALLHGCRLAHTIHRDRLEAAKLRMRCHRMGIAEEEIFEGRRAEGGAAKAEGKGSKAEGKAEKVERKAEGAGEAGSPDAESSAERNAATDAAGAPELSTEPCSDTNPKLTAPGEVRFRDLKEKWDKEIERGGNEMMDMRFPRHDENRELLDIARATPFERLAKKETERIERGEGQ